MHLSRLLGRITTFAILLLANEYIYSINTPSADKYPSTFAKAPGTFGQLMPTTDTMELQVEVRPDFYSDEINRMLALKKKLAGRLQSVLGLGVNVKLVEPRSIERSVGKAKRVIDNRKL